MVDTNHSPDGIDYVIPGNDDASKAVAIYAKGICQNQREHIFFFNSAAMAA